MHSAEASRASTKWQFSASRYSIIVYFRLVRNFNEIQKTPQPHYDVEVFDHTFLAFRFFETFTMIYKIYSLNKPKLILATK